MYPEDGPVRMKLATPFVKYPYLLLSIYILQSLPMVLSLSDFDWIVSDVSLTVFHICNRVSGCVGHGNYKFFFHFVTYTALYALWVFTTTLPTVVDAVTKRVINQDA